MMGDDQSKSSKVSFFHISSDGNFFNTKEQISRRKDNKFTDFAIPFALTGSNSVAGLFSQRKIIKDESIYNSSIYPTGSTSFDPSGNPRKYLALNIDYYASSSVDSYKNGIEITQDKHWIAGLFKISAGTPGHLIDKNLFGVNDLDIISDDEYQEIEVFDPIRFVETGGDPNLFTYPIVTSDSNQKENYTLNGIIEPFTIRAVVSNFSINFPFEPHSVWADYSTAGNTNHRRSCDDLVNIYEFEPNRKNKSFFLDAGELMVFETYNGTNLVTASLGLSNGYFSLDENILSPYKDEIHSRNVIPSASYSDDLKLAVSRFPVSGSNYIRQNEIATTCGFVYDNGVVDSIAYGGRLY